MRRIKLLLVLIMAGFNCLSYGQTVYADFDGIEMGFSSWDLATWKKTENPYPSTTNASANVAQFGHSGNNWWTGVNCNSKLPKPIDFKATPFMKMKVYSTNPIDVVMKLENFIDSRISTILTCELTAEQTNKWVELTFNFSGTQLTNLDRITLFFDPEQFSSKVGTKYYFDDIIASNVPPSAQVALLPASNSTNIPIYSTCTITSNLAIANANGTEITNPTSSMQFRKGGSNGTNIPFSASISNDKRTIIIASSELLEPATQYWYGVKDSMLKYPQIESYIANINSRFTTSTTAPALITYSNLNGVDNTIVKEPLGDPAGTMLYNKLDTTNICIKWNKGITNGGWERIHIELNKPINLSGDKVFSIRVYSPKTTFVRLKISNQKEDGGSFREADAFITKTNEWQTLYFNFSNFDIAIYKHLLIYIDGGIEEANTFMVDDIKGPNLLPEENLAESSNSKK